MLAIEREWEVVVNAEPLPPLYNGEGWSRRPLRSFLPSQSVPQHCGNFTFIIKK